jgi:isoquinoline 1-oxidoreductase subunit beta
MTNIDQGVPIGKEVQYPVKVTWTREEDIQHDPVRYVHRVAASLDDKGFPVALSHKTAGPSNLAQFFPEQLIG